ncbi:MAG: twin-arginine translocation signal domain-containing protein [Natrialbaceae archaeon]|nr:twin-arginine translocation signal domain-containing protein [Natrialbaceae archaeon]
MARDHPVRHREESPDGTGPDDCRSALLDRRDYLKLAGATTAAGAALVGGVSRNGLRGHRGQGAGHRDWLRGDLREQDYRLHDR